MAAGLSLTDLDGISLTNQSFASGADMNNLEETDAQPLANLAHVEHKRCVMLQQAPRCSVHTNADRGARG